jgi:predicted phosphodiesterase
MQSWVRRHGTALRIVAVIVVAAVAATVALSFVSARGDVGPGRVSLRTRWNQSGDTTIQVPPLGAVRFDTHDVPVGVVARVDAVDPAKVQRLASRPRALERIEAHADSEFRSLMIALVWRALLVAVVVGALTGLVLFRRSWMYPLIGAGTALVVVVALLATTWFAFSPSAFASPKFEGTLQEAPRVLETVRKEWGNLQGIRDRVEVLAGHVTELLELAADPSGPDDAEDDVRILHVSDIHSNPLGLEIARDLATSFDVDAILDTGDLTSFGFPVESRIGELVARMPVPYYLVPGNHDTLENRAALAGYPNFTVVDRSVIDVRGVRILGVADPAVTANDAESDAQANAERDAQAPSVARLTEQHDPDVLAVSTVRQAAESFGSVPLIVTGNTHKRSERVVDTTRVLTVGSTGATGLGSFTVESSLPYEAQLLHFRDGQLVTLDYVVLEGVSGNYTVSRTVITPLRASTELPEGTTTSTSTSPSSP